MCPKYRPNMCQEPRASKNKRKRNFRRVDHRRAFITRPKTQPNEKKHTHTKNPPPLPIRPLVPIFLPTSMGETTNPSASSHCRLHGGYLYRRRNFANISHSCVPPAVATTSKPIGPFGLLVVSPTATSSSASTSSYVACHRVDDYYYYYFC